MKRFQGCNSEGMRLRMARVLDRNQGAIGKRGTPSSGLTIITATLYMTGFLSIQRTTFFASAAFGLAFAATGVFAQTKPGGHRDTARPIRASRARLS